MTEYRLVRARRKTLSLRLLEDGTAEVRAPLRCPKAEIEAFVRDHEEWIRRHREQLLRRNEARDGFIFREGDRISLCGEVFTVHIAPGLKARFFQNRLLLPDGNPALCREGLLRAARERGLPWVRSRLDDWSRETGIGYTDLKLSSARTRWGSCSREGVIRISIWLLFAPGEAIDYVLVHELAHRRHFDHSPAFWALVESVLPDYGSRKRMLRAFQEEPFLQALAKRGE